ncbi:MAG: hydantoinase B/oxoprolinase family protein [Deltaproteobacteria bacterium]|nr:hydantoinase B/oxoprolinase family protein [Deltaproteobacteria bacterium]MBW2419842.1 hydantoinase B/oxoprolinase family protein [Deltaproteobacteria bacterium]
MSFEINRRLAAKRSPLDTAAEIDSVTADIIRGAFETICFESAVHLGRAASSAIINQSNERNASIIDAHGRLAGVSVGIPQLLFISPLAVRWGLEHVEEDDWGPGDVFMGNDPDHGGGHLPDYNVYTPVFDEQGELVVIQALQAHQGDTGGKDPGGFSVDAVDTFAEGMAFPCVKLVHRGRQRRDILEVLIRNNRLPSFSGDIQAMISGSQLGARLLGELLEKWGADVVRAAVNFNIDQTERRFREEVARWPDGSYEADVYIDHDTVGNEDVHVHVACIVDGDQLTVDMSGSDARPELMNVWNTFSNSRGYAMAQLASMVDPSIVKNEGLFNAVEMVIPEGSILQPPPRKPAALGAFHPAVEVGEAICIALSQILPERSSPQVYKLGMPNSVIGFDEQGQMWLDQGVDVRASDASATQGVDGWGSMCSGLGNLILAQAEDAESRFPVINLSREMTTDTGGAGRWRGQPGTLNVKKILEPTMAVAWMVSMKHPLRGLRGGDDAAPYSNHFEVGSEREYKIENSVQADLPADAVIAYQYGGGAGFESALLRDPEQVCEDVLDEYVSIEAARDRYGVVLTGSVEECDVEVDPAGTLALREKLAAERGISLVALAEGGAR